ncbi:hypothetical protein F66182_7355 [Fusarium sp. NRRL 66182]|nr:hypothetical protein F66182_7355 [Fusarium sp. NRRL 66182]
MILPKQFIVSVLLAAAPTSAIPQNKLTAARKPKPYTANPKIGPGGAIFKDSSHFRVYGTNGTGADQVLSVLEASYDCFVGTLGFRSSGLSFHDTSSSGIRTKTNVYSVPNLQGAAGYFAADGETGMGWLVVDSAGLADSTTAVHEYGHALNYHQITWVDQIRTGAWWETFAEWVSDTYRTSDICAPARKSRKLPTGYSIVNLYKNIGESFQPIVDVSNYYEAFPIFTYLTNNPDRYTGLGPPTLRLMMERYSISSNETPLHTLQRLVGKTSVADIIGRYWARMAYVDIGSARAREAFLYHRQNLNYANVDSNGQGRYTVKPGRKPQYMGSNIIPITAHSRGGKVTVTISTKGPYRATLALYKNGATRYITLRKNTASVSVASGEEMSLAVAHTPGLILYDPFTPSGEVKQGLDYSFKLSGATVTAFL